MDDFFNELFKWLEEQEDKYLDEANEHNCFEEVSKSEAFRWCAECSEETLEKIKKLRQKYELYDKINKSN